MGIMGFEGGGMMGGWAVSILALLFIVTGIDNLRVNGRKK